MRYNQIALGCFLLMGYIKPPENHRFGPTVITPYVRVSDTVFYLRNGTEAITTVVTSSGCEISTAKVREPRFKVTDWINHEPYQRNKN